MQGQYGIVDGFGTEARFEAPGDLAFDGAGTLYVTDANQVRQIDIATAEVKRLAGGTEGGYTDGPGGSARFSGPRGLATDRAGHLYVADTLNDLIRVVDVSKGAVTTVAGIGLPGSVDGTANIASFNRPWDVAADGLGNLYVSDSQNHTIRRIVLSTGVVSTLAGSAGTVGSDNGAHALFDQPTYLTLDGQGDLLISDRQGTVRRLALSSRQVSTLAGVAGQRAVVPGPLPALLNLPAGLAVLSDGSLALCDTVENSILLIH
jgi:hypothetical protein